ncbi:CIC_collapsed_G0000880.mRNA.1.CDS.1 [Saccharomyces cerevisiae]|nr:CIC_collapsed_G0000880.mRNA.1.CDS.1 [Saccharomyces cerevisiae]
METRSLISTKPTLKNDYDRLVKIVASKAGLYLVSNSNYFDLILFTSFQDNMTSSKTSSLQFLPHSILSN